MASRVSVHLNEAGIAGLLGPQGDVGRAVRRVADRTANLARGQAPVDTGKLRASIRVETRSSARAVRAEVVALADYALFVHQGTGIYGPTGRPIRPRRGQFLVFPAPRGGGLVFARQVRGQRPQPFLLRALRQASPWPVVAGRDL